MHSRFSGFWLLASGFLVLGPLFFWINLTDRELLIPATAVRRINSMYSDQLILLRHAQKLVPAGASYTTVAFDGDAEMSLFMFSLSELIDREPFPTSYYLHPTPDVGLQAKYVIAYRCEVSESGLHLLGRFPEGCVYERPWRQ